MEVNTHTLRKGILLDMNPDINAVLIRDLSNGEVPIQCMALEISEKMNDDIEQFEINDPIWFDYHEGKLTAILSEDVV